MVSPKEGKKKKKTENVSCQQHREELSKRGCLHMSVVVYKDEIK